MTQFQVQAIDGRFQVFATETGLDRRVIGVGFAKPRDAIAYSDQLAAMPSVSPLRQREELSHPDLAVPGEGVSRDADRGLLGSPERRNNAPGPGD